MSDEKELKHLTQREHFLKRPGVVIGSLKANLVKRFIYNANTNKVDEKEILAAEGIERLFLEGLSNASDNSEESRILGLDPGYIKIDITKKTVTICNTGKPYTIKKFPGTNKYVQEMAFGVIGTSTNYDDSKRNRVAGTNGYGIKLVNTYSKEFSLNLVDDKQNKSYSQSWSNNMIDVTSPIIKNTSGEKTYTEVNYTLDFDRFDDIYKDGYTEDLIGLYGFHCINTAFTTRVSVWFNGVEFKPMNVKEYIMMVTGTNLNSTKYLTHSEWFENKEIKTKTSINGIINAGNQSMNIEVCIYDTPDASVNLSFVNGLITYDGGIHVDTVLNRIKDVILPELNNKIKDGDRKSKLSLRDLRPHISVVVNCHVNEADYRSQMKSYLNHPKPNLTILSNKIKSMMRWKLIERLNNTIKAKQLKILKSTDGKKNNVLFNIKTLTDAPLAGSNKSHLCTIDLVEGNSAQNYSDIRSVAVNGGINRSDYIGSLALRGKIINALKAMSSIDGIQKLNENKVYANIKKAIGLRERMDYNIEKNFRTLRYGIITVLCDADVDGIHIAALIVLLIWKMFKSLLERKKVVYILRTPLIRVKKGKKFFDFFFLWQFEDWAEKNSLKGCEIQYCKGLASSSASEIDRDSKNPYLVEFDLDEQTDMFIDMAFGKNTAVRKQWLKKYKPEENLEELSNIAISRFIDKELILHSFANVHRTIPGLDGYKEGGRKVLYTSLKKWGSKRVLRTNELVTIAKGFTNYHYGAISLIKAVEKMTLDYTGSNNLPCFTQEGLFGTRKNNGDNAGQSRYTSVSKMAWWSKVFNKDDFNIWEYVMEEGQICEPKNLFPIIPMFLVNGSSGVGTAYSTKIPNYNPLDIIKWIISRINGTTKPKIVPWYIGFTGSIKVVFKYFSKTKVDGKEDKVVKLKKNILEPGVSEFYPAETGRSMITHGAFEYKMIKNGRKEEEWLVVTELPIGRSPVWYEENVLKVMYKNKQIKNYSNKCGNNNIDFRIMGLEKPTLKKLNLITTFGMTNMTILDENRFPRIFKRVDHLIEYWFQWRRQYYPKRIAKMIEIKEKDTIDIRNRFKFIKAIVRGFDEGRILGETLIIVKESKDSILKQLDSLELDYSLLKKVPTASYTKKGLEKLEEQQNKILKDLEYYRNIDPDKLWIEELLEFEKCYKKYILSHKKMYT